MFKRIFQKIDWVEEKSSYLESKGKLNVRLFQILNIIYYSKF